MKTIIKILFASSFIALMAFSCNKNNDTTFGLTNFTHSGCKTTSKSTAVDASGNQEMLVIKSENRFLDIKHINAAFNCCPGKLTASASLDNLTITIEENEEKGICNCNCPYDFSYKIGPLDQGTYTVILNHDNAEYYQFTLNFYNSIDTTVIIGKTNLKASEK